MNSCGRRIECFLLSLGLIEDPVENFWVNIRRTTNMGDFMVDVCYGPLDQEEKTFFRNLTFTGPCLHGGASTTSISAGGTAQESTNNSEGLWNTFMVTLTQVVED